MSGIIEAQTTCRWDVVINRYFTPNSSGLEEHFIDEGVNGSNPFIGTSIWGYSYSITYFYDVRFVYVKGF